MMKATSDQKTIISVIKQIIIYIESTRDIDHSQIYEYIGRELDTLNDIMPLQRRIALQNYIQDIYLIIKISREDDTHIET